MHNGKQNPSVFLLAKQTTQFTFGISDIINFQHILGYGSVFTETSRKRNTVYDYAHLHTLPPTSHLKLVVFFLYNDQHAGMHHNYEVFIYTAVLPQFITVHY